MSVQARGECTKCHRTSILKENNICMNCEPIFNPDDDYIVAAKELADYCGYAIEELFPSLAPYLLKYKLKKLRQTAPQMASIQIQREDLIDMLNLPEFVSLDKYMPGAVIMPNECGRLYGCRVIICDAMPPNQIAMISDVVWK